LRDAPVLDPVPAQGANVEYIVMEPARSDVAGGEGALRMRVFERGVGETRSCGTGACAAAIAAHHWAGEKSPLQWRVDVPGGQLRIEVDPNHEGTSGRVGLAGPAVLVASGRGSWDPDPVPASPNPAGPVPPYLAPGEREHAAAPRRARAHDCESVAERPVEPLLQGIGAEVLRYDEVGPAVGSQTRKPGLQQLVQGLPAGAERGIGPDRGELHLGGDVLGGDGADRFQTQAAGIYGGGLQGPGIDVEGPHAQLHLGVPGLQGRVQGDRAPTAAEVEHITGRRLGQMPQQHGRAEVEASGGEGPRYGFD